MSSSLLVRSLKRTICIDFPSHTNGNTVAVRELKHRITDIEGIPAQLQRLTCEGSELCDDDVFVPEHVPSIVLNLRLRGGKGGFGSLMRAYAAKLAAKSKNRHEDKGAMRDLNGRRIRHVETEKKIAEWQAQEHKVDHVGLQKSFKEIQQGKYLTADKGKCKYGVNCKYKWKCKYTHPDDEERERARRCVTSISSEFGESDEGLYEGNSRENILTAVKKGLQARKRQREESEDGAGAGGDNDDNNDDDDKVSNDTEIKGSMLKSSILTAQKRAKTDDKDDVAMGGKARDKAKKHDGGAAMPNKKSNQGQNEEKRDSQKVFGEIDLERYSSAKELEAVGLGHLKSELTRLGLKCGGNLTQRAERLFLLKTHKLEDLPKKIRAKKK
eukprot:jgi/Bigna1/46989/estExt_Genewise1.C_90007